MAGHSGPIGLVAHSAILTTMISWNGTLGSVTTTPDDLIAPLGRAGEASEIKLDPHAAQIRMSVEKPAVATDTYGFDIGAHRFGWRMLPWTTSEERTRSLRLVLDGEQIGAVFPDVLDGAKLHQQSNNAKILLWGEPAECDVVGTERHVSGMIPKRLRSTTVQCYEIRWRGHCWVIAMHPFPRTFGLWVNSAAAGIRGAPAVTYTKSRLTAPARLAWSPDATLLDVLVCLTRGYLGAFTHLASTRAQISYSFAAETFGTAIC